MGDTIEGRTGSRMPSLDFAEQRSWQNYLDSALGVYAALNRSLVDAHQLTLNDVRLLDVLERAPNCSARMGDIADELMSLPSRVTRQAQPAGGAQPGPPSFEPRGRPRRRGLHHRRRPRAARRGDGDVRPRGACALSEEVVARPSGLARRELPPHRGRLEGRRRALPVGPGLARRLPLSVVAWQSGLMHSP